MGQYWKPVNLDKREYIMPHKLGVGLKLLEQGLSQPGTVNALFFLVAAMPYRRGGGDPDAEPGVIGRWAGDRIAIVGDYGEFGDIQGAPEVDAGRIYYLANENDPGCKDIDFESEKFTDISELIAPVLEKWFCGKYTGTNCWRKFERNE